MDTKFSRSVMRASVAIVSVATATPAMAQTRSFDVPAQSASSGIAAMAHQANIQIFAARKDTNGKRTNAVKGEMSVEEALAALLSGTGLTVRKTGDQTYTVIKAPSAPRTDPVASLGDGTDSGQEIVVTGTNIRGLTKLSVPTLIIDRQSIDQTGFATVEDVFDSIPQNFGGLSFDGRLSSEGGSRLARSNNDRASAIDLRGLGPQSTLTLVNGTRRAGSAGGRVVDISALPLSLIERVEIVTGARSAIYGSDAVAGVVNLVTRRNYDGAETQVSGGYAPEGGERFQVSQILGTRSDKGGFVVAYDFTREWELKASRLGVLSPGIQNTGVQYIDLTLQPKSRRHVFYGSGSYNLTDNMEVFADASYSYRRFTDTQRTIYSGSTTESIGSIVHPSEQYNISGGVRKDLGPFWRVTASGTDSVARNTLRLDGAEDFGSFSYTYKQDIDDRTSTLGGTIVAEGPLPIMFGIRPRLAIGGEFRQEKYKSDQQFAIDGAFEPPSLTHLQRDIRSAFAELALPIDMMPGKGFEISLAGRFDNYSDFGSTFNPQGGVSWEVLEGFVIRGGYSKAFRAPSLIELGNATYATIDNIADPTRGGSLTPVLILQGDNKGIGPEKAETWSFGADLKPREWLTASFSYYNIRYRDRIEVPAPVAEQRLALVRESLFPGLINRAPSSAEANGALDLLPAQQLFNRSGRPFDAATQQILDVFPELIIFDDRTNNIASEAAQGIDVNLAALFDTGIGKIDFGLNGTYVLEHKRRTTATSPLFSVVNEVGKPVDLRVRANFGWQRGSISTQFYVNYTDGYKNPFTDPASKMRSWTTMDATLRFDGRDLAHSGLLDGLTATLAINNILDERPPLFLGGFAGIRYDAANASPVGRYISVRLTKKY